MQDKYATRIWTGLVLLTLFAYLLSLFGLNGQLFVLTLLLTSLIKGQMIIDRFMMLNTAPLLWRLLLSLWLLVVLLVISAMYYAFG